MSSKNHHGGNRSGAGRPRGTGKYKAPTKTMRVPVNMQEAISTYIDSKGNSLPFYSSTVQAGYPSPAQDEAEPERVNLYSLLIENPDETYVLKASGESMINAGINPDDMLVVDRKQPAINGAIVIASINGEFTVKRLEHKNGQPVLMPENPDYQPIPVGENDDVHIFGVVTHSIHALK
jgi:DNA polymerase V